MLYPVKLQRDHHGAILASFPDVPGAVTFGAGDEEALARGAAALETVFMGLIADRETIPPPSRPRRGQPAVRLPALTEAKLLLYEALRESRLGKAELARRLGWHPPQVDRLFDLGHASRLDQIEAAFAALGRRLRVVVEDAESSLGFR